MTARQRSGRPAGQVRVGPVENCLSPGPTPLPVNLTERQFQDKVATLARWCGWKVVHFSHALRADGRHYTPVRYDGKGFVDLQLIHPERKLMWFREVKATGGRLRPEQAQWRTWLRDAGLDWAIWWPPDWDDIVAALSDGQAVAT